MGIALAATYLTFDLAGLLGARVSGCFFASPQPGDDEFAKAFEARVQAYQVWNFDIDVVPRLPFGSNYIELPKVTWISPSLAQARIKFSLDCHHHVLVYCSMLDFDLLDWATVPICDQSNAACIKGPSAVIR